ncbi:plasmid mobilization protein [Atopobiaceae bacterium LCP21S3_F11]
MPCENGARKRSKTMAFRCTPEEYELIANMAAWSGMSRQDYIMARLTGTEITVRPSSRTQRALRDSIGLATQNWTAPRGTALPL